MLPPTPASTSLQKFQRAFTQEFLYASEDLKNLLNDDDPGEDAMEYAAAHFEVSPLIARRTMKQLGVLRPEVLEEWTG